jgi:Tetratricopeptide repeat
VAIDVNNMGGVLRALGDLDGARQAFQRALAILEKVFGPDHPRTQTVRGNLAALAAPVQASLSADRGNGA